MFLENEVSNLRTTQWKSDWFSANAANYQQHIYEDVFIRKYVSSLLLRWIQLSRCKVLGSVYLARTFGKLFIKAYFFYPSTVFYVTHHTLQKKVISQVPYFSNSTIYRPIIKCKKVLSILLLFYQLEKMLGIQVFFKFINICNGPAHKFHLGSECLKRIFKGLTTRFSYFRFQFKGSLYTTTILCLVHLFKFKRLEGDLFARFIAYAVLDMKKHTVFLVFLKRVLKWLHKFFKFRGVKILLSGKLNGFSRAQSKQIQVGRISLQSFSTPYNAFYSSAFTTAGTIGIKVWHVA